MNWSFHSLKIPLSHPFSMLHAKKEELADIDYITLNWSTDLFSEKAIKVN